MDDFKKTLTDIVAEGISVKVHVQDIIEEQPRKSAKIIVEGNDRRGIVEEFSSTLVEKNVNVEKF